MKVLRQYMLNGYAINEIRVMEIKSSIDDLVLSHKILKEDVRRIENLLLKLIERPIVIHNNLSIGSEKLEEKIIKLLDQIMIDLGSNQKVRNKLKGAKQDLSCSSKNIQTQNRIIDFF